MYSTISSNQLERNVPPVMNATRYSPFGSKRPAICWPSIANSQSGEWLLRCALAALQCHFPAIRVAFVSSARGRAKNHSSVLFSWPRRGRRRSSQRPSSSSMWNMGTSPSTQGDEMMAWNAVLTSCGLGAGRCSWDSVTKRSFPLVPFTESIGSSLSNCGCGAA